ncbi:tail fiber assembly protein [Pantoea trifolii]|uniref:Tail fiber assembly protein n=1 Tax=Pantoea trifolii TaxID=2968030 RepID=A0ABT1VNI5_9GAMM|nr:MULTISPECIES: tail fiber assembly protein [unclassified Pantoea]MCQ8229093.1 tail fiber assembly protein [Pantoea sp. MMK2]MCQ8237267.1 tail fiber assembly protein [Pantoea sp. MMK3]
MNEYVYSASFNMICAVALRNDYELAGTWPDDALEISMPTAIEFMGEAPSGKMMAAGTDGLPQWCDLPPLTPSELAAEAVQRKDNLLGNAQQAIGIWQTKLALGRISDAEKTSLNIWLDYIDALQAVDASAAPDIDWPETPKQ